MATQLEPYLFFTGNCEDALNFYKSVFGGEIVHISRFKDMPPDVREGSSVGPEHDNRVMHATFKSPSFGFMASDGSPGKQYGEGSISLSLGMSDESEAQRIFDRLAEGGNVEVPLADSFWGAKFGMLTDKFGIDWMVNCQVEAPT
ncbi:MAG: VOC family protein [Candidatus Tumulicola sp.]